MKALRRYLTLLWASSSVCGYAGNTHIGNGGNARVCRSNGAIVSVEFFDYWENFGRRPRLVLDLGADDLPYMDKVRLAVDRLARLSPLRAALYLKWAENFNSEMNPVSDKFPLRDPSDSVSPFDPQEIDGCKTEQLALQQIPKSPWEARYLVRASLWERLGPNGKAGLILHELIYREANELSGHQDSEAVRFLNSLLASKVMETLTLEEFLDLLKTYQFTSSDVNGHWVSLGVCLTDPSRTDRPALSCSSANYLGSELTYFRSGNLRSVKNVGLLNLTRSFHPRQIVTGMGGSPYTTEQVPYLGLCHTIHFTDDGKLRQLCEGDDLEFQKVVVKPYDPFFIVRAILFDAAGKINGILMDKNHATAFWVGEKRIMFRTGENRVPVMFHAQGHVASGILAQDADFKDREDRNIRLLSGTFATFDSEGVVQSSTAALP